MVGEPLSEPTLESRTVLLSGVLQRDAVNRATMQLLALSRERDRPVALLVNSPGGALGEVAAMLDVLVELRVPTEVTALGRAHGAAGLLVAAAPGRRLIGTRATLSLRVPEDDDAATGTADELARRARTRQLLLDALRDQLARRTGRTPEWLRDQFRDGEVFGAEDAVDLGLVDATATRH